MNAEAGERWPTGDRLPNRLFGRGRACSTE